MAGQLTLRLLSVIGNADSRARLGIPRGPFGGWCGGALSFSSPKQAGIHTPVVRDVASTSYGMPAPLQTTEAGLYRLSYVHAGQPRFWVVVARRSTGLLERVLARYHVALHGIDAARP
jgi:hypothetical protein